ncbi:MAG: uncharacterized protein QOE44_2136 [Solirubrobacteraceae bacterium]|jgi:carbon monoxide dehydrogenase subunit G|nr:uncharacterized protein [Solirubrobacteraceae bacterium]
MKLENSFSVRAPIDVVWAALLDIERVAPCVPGARLLERTGDDAFGLELEVGLDGASASYRAEAAIVDHEAADRRVLLSVTGTEADGDGGAEARIVLTLAQAGELTEGHLSGELALTGEAAGVDAGVIHGASERLLDSFARNLAVLLGGGAATVNGSGPESAIGPPPGADADPAASPANPAILAGVAGATAQHGEAAAATTPAGDPGPPESAWATPPPSPAEAGWAGASRQAGLTIERLRGPLGMVALGFVVLAGLVGRRRRVRRPATTGEPRPPVAGAPAGPVG